MKKDVQDSLCCHWRRRMLTHSYQIALKVITKNYSFYQFFRVFFSIFLWVLIIFNILILTWWHFTRVSTLYIRAILDEYWSELQKVSICLLKLMAKNLKINPNQLTNIFENGRQHVRMNYFPLVCMQERLWAFINLWAMRSFQDFAWVEET